MFVVPLQTSSVAGVVLSLTLISAGWAQTASGSAEVTVELDWGSIKNGLDILGHAMAMNKLSLKHCGRSKI